MSLRLVEPEWACVLVGATIELVAHTEFETEPRGEFGLI
jgi:hypothetical protein